MRIFSAWTQYFICTESFNPVHHMCAYNISAFLYFLINMLSSNVSTFLYYSNSALSSFSNHAMSLQWRHNERDGVSNHQPRDCLLDYLFGRRSKKTSKLRVTGICVGNSLVTGKNSPHKRPVTWKMFPFDDVIMYFCRVMVLSEGKIAEFDTPSNLLNDEDSIFRSMCYDKDYLVRVNNGNGWNMSPWRPSWELLCWCRIVCQVIATHLKIGTCSWNLCWKNTRNCDRLIC